MPVPKCVSPANAIISILSFHITPDLPTAFAFSNRGSILRFIKGHIKLFAFIVKPHDIYIITLFYNIKSVNNVF